MGAGVGRLRGNVGSEALVVGGLITVKDLSALVDGSPPIMSD